MADKCNCPNKNSKVCRDFPNMPCVHSDVDLYDCATENDKNGEPTKWCKYYSKESMEQPCKQTCIFRMKDMCVLHPDCYKKCNGTDPINQEQIVNRVGLMTLAHTFNYKLFREPDKNVCSCGLYNAEEHKCVLIGMDMGMCTLGGHEDHCCIVRNNVQRVDRILIEGTDTDPDKKVE